LRTFKPLTILTRLSRCCFQPVNFWVHLFESHKHLAWRNYPRFDEHVSTKINFMSPRQVSMKESSIISREIALRAWFTCNADSDLIEIDGLDIGWGGVQRWATAQMFLSPYSMHLDIACGYGTFLGQLGWRFPNVRLIGLNIDFAGPHASIRELLTHAGVHAALVQADGRHMPFSDGAFDSVSCFLGLQDIEIGFELAGVKAALADAVRVLKFKGTLTLLDEFNFTKFENLFMDLPVVVLDKAERALDCRWNRQVAERAVDLYADGWVAQNRPANPAERRRLYTEIHARMKAEMKRQLREQGFYVPFGPVHMIILQKG
jgi:ubiquinone/menaquinone biosynthesis C-methylase UbiE